MYISMKTYSKKFLVTFFFSMLPMLLMSCSMDPGESLFLNFREFGEVTDR